MANLGLNPGFAIFRLILRVSSEVEVAQQEGCAASLHGTGQKFHGHTHIGSSALRVEIYQFADDIEYVFTTFFGRYILLNLIGEEDHSYLVVVLNGAEGQCGGNLSDHILFRLNLCAELQRTTDVDEKHHSQLTLFLKHLHIRSMEASGYVPIDVAHIVAILVFTHFAECHTTPFEGRVILTSEDIIAQTSGLDFYLPNFLENLRCFHVRWVMSLLTIKGFPVCKTPLWHLNLIDDFTDNFFARHIRCLSLITQANTVTQHVVNH